MALIAFRAEPILIKANDAEVSPMIAALARTKPIVPCKADELDAIAEEINKKGLKDNKPSHSLINEVVLTLSFLAICIK